MDITKDIVFRLYKVNDSAIRTTMVPGNGIGAGISGCVVDSADFSDVDVVQFLEKRSLQDGMDAGDVFLGARRLRMAGTLYGTTRALLYDKLQELKRVFSPTLAQRESPADKGFLPMYFSVPTNRISDYPTGAIDCRILVRPHALQTIFQRDNIGGEGSDSLAIPWQATFVMKDPRVMSAVTMDVAFANTTEVSATGVAATDIITSNAHGLSNAQRIYFTVLVGGAALALNVAYYVISATTNTFQVSLTSGGAAVNFTTDLTAGSKWARVTTAAGNLNNRGDYHAPLNALWVVGAQAGSIVLSLGGSNFTITVPASTGDRTIRYKGEDKILTVEEAGIEGLRMDLLTFQNQTTHPLVSGGLSPYTVTFTGVVVKTGSHMWFWESFA